MISEFESLYGKIRTVNYACNDTILDVAKKLGVPYTSQPIICLKAGEPVLRKDWDKPLGMLSNEIKFIQIPKGETVKNILRLVAVVALTAIAGPAGLGISAALGGGILGSLGVAAFVAGGLFLINSFLGSNSPITKTQSTQAASPTYNLSAQGNSARLLEPIPRLYGTHIIYPDFASQPYQSYENNEQYLYELFCLGVGEYDINTINIGETKLWDSTNGLSNSFSDVSLEIIPPGSYVTLFPSNVYTSDEVSGQELRHEFFSAVSNFSGDIVTFNSNIPTLEYLSPGDSLYITGSGNNNGTFTIVDLDTTEDYTWIKFNTTFSTESGNTKNFDLVNWLGPYIANPSSKNTNLIKIDITLSSGLYYSNDQGGLSNTSISYEAWARSIDSSGNPTSDWFQLIFEEFVNNTVTPQRYTRSFEVSLGRYEVRARRYTIKNHDARYGNTINWGGLRAFIPDDNLYEDVTLLALKIRASNQLSQTSSTQINVIQSGKIPVWNGVSWSAPVINNNPSWIAADILRNENYGAGLADYMIDLDKLLILSNTYEDRGDSFNGVFDTSKTLWDSLIAVLNVVRTQPILIAGKITFVRDELRTLARTVITPQSILKNTFEMTHVLQSTDTADDVIVEFMDENTWSNTEVQATLPDSTSSSPARLNLFGVTNISQAWREGMYYAASNKYRRVMASVSTEADGRLLLKGDPVIVSHDVPKWSQSGFIMEFLEEENTLILDRDVIFDSTSNSMILRRRDGKEFGPIDVIYNGYSNEVVLETGSLEAIEISQGISIQEVLSIDDEAKRTTYVFIAGGESYVKRFIVVSSNMRELNKVELNLTIDDNRVYNADTGTPPDVVDYAGPGVVSNGPIVDSIYVNQSPFSEADPVTLNIYWTVSAGATNYILQYSNNGSIWNTIYSGVNTSYTTNINAGILHLRVAAIGELIGPWKIFTGTFGTPTLLPGIVSNLTASADVGAGTLEVSYLAAARANSYLVEVYIEEVSGSNTFENLKLSKTVATTFTSWTSSEITAVNGPWNRIEIRVTASNSNGYGAFVFTRILDITLGDVTSLSLIIPYTGVEAQFQWDNVSSATGYRIKIYNPSSVLVRETVVNTNNFYYTNAQLTADGGPWRSFDVTVNAESSALIGPINTLNIEDLAPSIVTDVSSSSPSTGTLDISWTANPSSDVTGYIVYRSTTSGFTPSSGNIVYNGTSNSISLTGLTSGTHYFRIATKDSYAGGTGYNTTTQSSQVVL